MKISPIALAFAACATLACAQESIESEKLQKIVGRLMERASDQENLPLKMEVDGSKAVGMKVKNYGTAILPEKNLAQAALEKAGAEIVPVGYLWLNGLVPATEGKGLAAEKLRPVKIVTEQQEVTLQLLMLGLRKKAESGFELVVYTQGKEAVLTLPLKEEKREQGMPVQLGMRAGSESLGLVDIHILGHLQATLQVALP